MIRSDHHVTIVEELRHDKTLFYGVFEGSRDALVLLTEEGFYECNRQALELFAFVSK